MKDITGQKFGELTAVRPTEERYHGSVVWECKCSCGKTCYVSVSSLCSGLTKSCGHLRHEDLRGVRFSRLVALHPLEKRYHSKKLWLCRCDCGGVTIAGANGLKNGNNISCGCVSRRRTGTDKTAYARCPSCGVRFPIALNGEQTPQFCETCAPKYAGRSWRVCPICGKLFPEPPSSKTIACSKECSTRWKSMIHNGVSNQWSHISRARLSQRGQTENLKLGTDAAKESQIAGRFETNREAKIWTLIDPSGKEVIVRNLLLWARENTELFGKPPGDKSAEQISCGFRAIAQTLTGARGVPGKQRGALSYFGWTLKSPPEEPPH